MTSSIVTNHNISGTDIEPITNDIEEAIWGYLPEQREHVILALLCMVLHISDPELTNEQLSNHVRDVSSYICLLLGTGLQGKELIN